MLKPLTLNEVAAPLAGRVIGAEQQRLDRLAAVIRNRRVDVHRVDFRVRQQFLAARAHRLEACEIRI